MTPNCTLAVYRREYDGKFTEIETNISNQEDLYVVDPHPSLDYARYRIVARTSDTGAISYSDIDAVKVGEPSAVIQWGEKWTPFMAEEGDEEYVEPPVPPEPKPEPPEPPELPRSLLSPSGVYEPSLFWRMMLKLSFNSPLISFSTALS